MTNQQRGPVVSVCIVNWNCCDHLSNCLSSLHRQSQGLPFETIVVDNGSQDGAAEMVARDFPAVVLIRNATNAGFSRGNNQAARAAKGRFLFFLNNDTEVPAETLGRLVQFAQTHPEAGIIGPRLRSGDGKLQVSYRMNPSLITFLHRTSFFRWIGLWRGAYRRYRRQEFDPEATRPVDILMGAAMFIPREVFFASGGWDEDFIFGGEDAELCTRIGRNHPIVFHPGAEVIHFGRVSTRRHIGFATTQMRIGFARYFRKCGYSRPAILFFKIMTTLDSPTAFLSKGLQYLWRQLSGRHAKAEKSLLAMRAEGHFMRSGLVAFWRA
jgi:GT2 family glycosyltransferase